MAQAMLSLLMYDALDRQLYYADVATALYESGAAKQATCRARAVAVLKGICHLPAHTTVQVQAAPNTSGRQHLLP
jgi:hypothetical protein